MSALASQAATHRPAPKREAPSVLEAVVVRWIIRGMTIDEGGMPVILADVSQSATLECRADVGAGARAELVAADGRRRVVLHVCEKLAPGAFEATPAAGAQERPVVNIDVPDLFSATLLPAAPSRLLYVRTTLLDALAVPGGRAEVQGFEVTVS